MPSLMQNSVRPADVLLFQCNYCQTELSVPFALQGVIGPCPCCVQQIQAPHTAPLPLPLSLPPQDGAHEALTAPVPLPVWMERSAAPAGTMPAAPVILRSPLEDSLLPRQLADHESLGFHAKLNIPQSEEPLDDTWRERHLEDRRRQRSINRLDRTAEQFMNSKAWRVTRAAILLFTGGLCAGLALYLQDRNWVLELPWRPAAVSTVAELSAVQPPVRSRAIQPAEPFFSEDPSDLESPARAAALMPVPEAVSMPVNAAPIASGKK